MAAVLSFRSRRVQHFDFRQQHVEPLARIVLVKDSKDSKVGLRLASIPDSSGETRVDFVHPGGLAELAGLLVDDVIVAIDGVAVKGAKHGSKLFAESEMCCELSVRRASLVPSQATLVQCL